MARKKQMPTMPLYEEPLPMLKTVEMMARVSGIGENKLRELLDAGQIAYVANGNRRLIADEAVWDWYERNKVCAAACV